jgi:truncated hemoglobin YjbI
MWRRERLKSRWPDGERMRRDVLQSMVGSAVEGAVDPGTWVFISTVGCLLIVAALVLVLALAERLDRRNDPYPARRTAAPVPVCRHPGAQVNPDPNIDPAELSDAGLAGSDIYPELPDTYLLFEAPTLTDPLTGMQMPLRKWPVTFHPVQKQVWAELVSLFYTRAATDPGIAAYFTSVDLPKLQGHFLAALVLLTGEGLDVGTVRRLHTAHRTVVNTDDKPITDDIFDRTAATLAEVVTDALAQTRVGPHERARAVAQLGRMVAVLKPHVSVTA